MVAKLGNFLVDIETNVNERGIKSLTKSLKSLTKGAAGVGLALAGVTAGAGYGFAKFIKSTVDEASELGKLAKDLDTTTTFIETFMRASKLAGSSTEEAVSTIRTLNKEVEAFRWGEGNPKAFGMLGINMGDFNNNFENNFNVIRRKFNEKTALQRLYFIDQIGLGEQMLRVLRLTDEEYTDLVKTSQKAPLLSQEQLDSADKYKKSLIEIDQTLTGLKRNLILGATPAFSKFSDEMIKLFNDPAFQKNVTKVFEELLKILPEIIKILPDFAKAIIKIADFLVPDSTGNPTVDKSFFARAGSKALNVLSGGFMVDSVAGTTFEQRMSPKNRRGAAIQNKVNRRAATKSEISEQDLLDHERTYGSNVTRIINAKSSSTPTNINNSYTINVPVQNAGGNLDQTKMNDFARIIGNEIDRRNQEASQNFKSGRIR